MAWRGLQSEGSVPGVVAAPGGIGCAFTEICGPVCDDGPRPQLCFCMFRSTDGGGWWEVA